MERVNSLYTKLVMLLGVTWPGIGLAGAELPEFDCLIEPHMVVDVGSRVDGVIETISVDNSDVVEKRQVLVQLESTLEKANGELARVRAALGEEIAAGEANLSFS